MCSVFDISKGHTLSYAQKVIGDKDWSSGEKLHLDIHICKSAV